MAEEMNQEVGIAPLIAISTNSFPFFIFGIFYTGQPRQARIIIL